MSCRSGAIETVLSSVRLRWLPSIRLPSLVRLTDMYIRLPAANTMTTPTHTHTRKFTQLDILMSNYERGLLFASFTYSAH